MRSIAIVSYFLIFLPGWMILLPYELLLFSGLFTAEPFIRILFGFANVALFDIWIYFFKPYSKTKQIVENVTYIVLFFPLVFLLAIFSLDWFDYWHFLASTHALRYFFPASIYQIYKKRRIASS